ncbi:MAG: PAS domain S-box protein [Pseudomonadota bacterium]
MTAITTGISSPDGSDFGIVAVHDHAEDLGALLGQTVALIRSAIMITDRLGHIEYVNPAFSEITGYSFQEVMGRNPRFLQSGRVSQTTYQEMWQTITCGATWRGQVCNRRSDGRLYWEEQNISPLRNQAGVITHFVAVKEDVTEARQNMLLYTGVIRSSSSAFLVLDESLGIVEWSPQAERLFGWRATEVTGLNFVTHLVAPEMADGVCKQFEQFRSRRRSPLIGTPQRLNLRRRNGETFVAELWLTAVDLDDEIRFTGFIRDLTEAVQSEQQLFQAQKMEAIGQLTGGLAHDFNNLLGIISGSLGLLAMTSPEIPGKKHLDTAIAAAKRGAGITRSLLAVARRRSLKPVETDLNSLIEEMDPLIRQSAGKAIEVTVAAGETPRVRIDPSGFTNALINLVINARDAMPEGGQILVYTYGLWIDEDIELLTLHLTPGEYVVVGVDDSGPGMPPSVAARAFEPFYTTKTGGSGSGLGLAMVYGFCRQSGGIARIESTAGRGCSVQMLLPGVSTGSQFAGEGKEWQRKAHKLRILLVDDNPDLLRIGHEWLEHLGHEVFTAPSPAKALSRFSTHPIDLMITDIFMPGGGGNGIELAEEALKIQPQLQLLFVTGHIHALDIPMHWQIAENASGSDDALRCFADVGGSSWRVLEKPFDLEQLTQAVSAASEARPLVVEEPV